MKKRFFAIAVCLLCLTALAPAQEIGGLTLGRIELRSLTGINFGTDRGPLKPRTPLSLGVEGAVGLHRYFAVIGGYSFNGMGKYDDTICVAYTCVRPEVKARIHEYTGGFRVTADNRSPIEPYATFSMGAARLSATASAGRIYGTDISAGVGANKLVFGPGGGVNFKIGRRAGVHFDVRAMRPLDMNWYFRPSAGFFFRFN